MAEDLLADFRSREERRVLHAVWEVFKTRDPEVLTPLVRMLPAIRKATDDLELGGALLSNAQNLEHALERIRLFGARDCLCAAYPGHVLYEPAKEERYGHARLIEEIPVVVNGVNHRPKRICECVDCGQRFSIEEGEYHYTWWKWTPIKTRPSGVES